MSIDTKIIGKQNEILKKVEKINIKACNLRPV